MGLFGPPKIKIAPHDFVKAELDRIFSPDFALAETTEFTRLTGENSMLRVVSPDTYLRERHNVIVNLFQIAWDRTVPYPIFTQYASTIHDDPRVKAVDTGAYDRALSRAQEAGMGYFWLYFGRIPRSDTSAGHPEFEALYVIFGTDFTDRYTSYEAFIKRHRFNLAVSTRQ